MQVPFTEMGKGVGGSKSDGSGGEIGSSAYMCEV